MNQALVSLGGWCGPALALGKMDLRHKAYPFDFSRVTFDGVMDFMLNGFKKGFFPAENPPYGAECVGQWILFRSQHCAFAHYNLNDKNIQDGFQRKFDRFNQILNSTEKVTFFRTITSRNPTDEIDLLPTFVQTLEHRNSQLPYRLVMIAHDQPNSSTQCLGYHQNKNISIWNLSYDRTNQTEETSLFDMTYPGYKKIIETSLREEHWNSLQESSPEKLYFKSHENLSLIDGEAMVRGSCGGIGSTVMQTPGTCPYCDTKTGHRVTKAREYRAFTKDEDEIILAKTYTLVMGSDLVGVIEEIANQLRRGTDEVIARIQALTTSTKLFDVVSPGLKELAAK